MSPFWRKEVVVTPELADKQEKARKQVGQLAAAVVDLDSARHRLEALMTEMLTVVDKSHGRHD